MRLAGFQANPLSHTLSQPNNRRFLKVEFPIQTLEYKFNLSGLWQPQGDADKTLDSHEKQYNSAKEQLFLTPLQVRIFFPPSAKQIFFQVCLRLSPTFQNLLDSLSDTAFT